MASKSKTKELKRNRRKSRRTTATTRRRMEEVLSMMAACVPEAKMREQLASNWGVKERTVDEYIDRVFDSWRMLGQDPDILEKRRDKQRFRYEMLYMRAGQLKQTQTQLGILKALDRLDGLDAPREVKIDGQFAVAGVQLGTLGFKSPQEVLERIDQLREQLASGAPTVLGQLPPALEAAYAEWEEDDEEDDE